jgi:two-component system, NtrC family, sensor histidine kinase HydH
MRMWRTVSLRQKILLTVLVGAVLPLGLIGLWLTRSASRSGEMLLREQLTASLASVEQELGTRWVHRRSDLLLLAGNEAVQDALRLQPVSGAEEDRVLHYLHDAYAALQPAIERVRYTDATGQPRWILTADPAQVPNLEPAGDPVWPQVVPASSSLPIALDILDSETGGRLGVFEAFVRMSSLLPPGTERVGPGVTVLAVLERGSGASLLPTPYEPALLAADHFDWEGQRWLAVRRSLAEPAVDLVLAAPLDPYTLPFERTARQGALALLAVALFGLGVAALLTRRMTHSLVRLTAAAEAVARGDLERTMDAGGEDEVGRVAYAFNTMTESLRRTLRELSQRQALAAVGEFASALAHEVRNPLTAIRLDLQYVQEKLPADSRLRAPLTRALDGVQRLDRAVTGSLRVARSGRVERESLELRTVLEGALHSARPEFAARGAALEPLGDGAHGIRIQGDAAALGQLFLNLLLNAAQALEPGGRAGLTVRTVARTALVSVWDNGQGIPVEKLEQVLQPFYSTKPEGTGLGLSIAQRIAAAHGGDLHLESAPGVGTTIRVRLPLNGAPGGYRRDTTEPHEPARAES